MRHPFSRGAIPFPLLAVFVASSVACASSPDDLSVNEAALDRKGGADPSPGNVSGDPNAGFHVKGLAGKCMAKDPKTNRVVLTPCAAHEEQRVRVIEYPGRLVELRIGANGCVRPLLGVVGDGVVLEVAPCSGAPSQKWLLDGDGIRLAANDIGKEAARGELSKLVVGVRNHEGSSGSALALVSVRRDESDYWEFLPDDGAPRYPTTGFVPVATTAELVAALGAATPGAVIEVARGAILDTSDYCWLPVLDRVTLRGEGERTGRRPILPAARIVYHTSKDDPRYRCCLHQARSAPSTATTACLSDSTPADREDMALLKMGGEGARITGLAIEGPSTSTSADTSVMGIQTTAHEDLGGAELAMEIDHSDLYGFPLAAVNVWGARPSIPVEQCQSPRTTSAPVVVQRSYIHANRKDGSGYGVALGGDGRATILGNTFMGNRHAISGSGDSGQSYYAYGNFTLFSAPKQSFYRNQDFDMHGTGGGDCTVGSSSGRGGTAGDVVDIRHNTFLGDNRNNFLLRGAPCQFARFADNVTRQSSNPALGYQAATTDTCDDDLVVPFSETGNRYEIGDPTGTTVAHDFDGDGLDDLFVATGAAYYLSFAGKTSWRFRAFGTDALRDLRFGDFDGDGRTDVVRSTRSLAGVSAPHTIQVRWGGEGEWAKLFDLDAEIDDLAVGDFDGDGRADLLHLDGSAWQMLRGNGTTAGWGGTNPLFSVRARDVRVGRFDSDGRDDVLIASSGKWYFISAGVPTSTTLIGPARGSFDDLRFADVNGDGLTDAVRVATTFHQESFGTATIFETKSSVSYSARQPFADERMYSRAAQGSPDAMIRLAPLGRFDGKPGADLLQWRADRRLDLQSGVIEPALLHSYDDGVTKNEMY